MRKIRFTHMIMVPNHPAQQETANSYIGATKDFTRFPLSQEEFEALRRKGGLFDLFDSAFGTLIDDCEEDMLSSDQVAQAIEMVKDFMEHSHSGSAAGLNTILQSLEYALDRGVHWEIANEVELYE